MKKAFLLIAVLMVILTVQAARAWLPPETVTLSSSATWSNDIRAAVTVNSMLFNADNSTATNPVTIYAKTSGGTRYRLITTNVVASGHYTPPSMYLPEGWSLVFTNTSTNAVSVLLNISE